MTLEETLREDLLLDLLEGPNEYVTDALYKRTTWGAKISVIWIPDPTQTAYAKFETSEQ